MKLQTMELVWHRKKLEKSKNPFDMIDKARGRKTEGVGLGMAIAGKNSGCTSW